MNGLWHTQHITIRTQKKKADKLCFRVRQSLHIWKMSEHIRAEKPWIIERDVLPSERLILHMRLLCGGDFCSKVSDSQLYLAFKRVHLPFLHRLSPLRTSAPRQTKHDHSSTSSSSESSFILRFTHCTRWKHLKLNNAKRRSISARQHRAPV